MECLVAGYEYHHIALVASAGFLFWYPLAIGSEILSIVCAPFTKFCVPEFWARINFLSCTHPPSTKRFNLLDALNASFSSLTQFLTYPLVSLQLTISLGN
jgi:hypothetical protein